MFIIGALLAATEALSVISTVGQSAYDSVNESEGLRKAIIDTKNRTASLKQKWDSIISQQSQLTNEIRAQILEDLDAISKNKASIDIAKENFQKNFTKIQMAGVSFVVVIFFLLLLKRAGILDYLEDLIFSSLFGK